MSVVMRMALELLALLRELSQSLLVFRVLSLDIHENAGVVFLEEFQLFLVTFLL